MQEKESIMVVGPKSKIPSLGKPAQHHLASLMMPNSYPPDKIFNPHHTTIKDSYNPAPLSPGEIEKEDVSVTRWLVQNGRQDDLPLLLIMTLVPIMHQDPLAS